VFDAPKPEPVTVMSVPPELPLDGEMERRTGSIVAEVKLAYWLGRPSVIRTLMFLEVLSLAEMTLKYALITPSVSVTLSVVCAALSMKRVVALKLEVESPVPVTVKT
jgi:hypothetical protein